MLLIASVQRSTPTKGLNIIYNIVPLPLFLQYTGIKSYARQINHFGLDWEGTCRRKTRGVAHRKYWMDLVGEWNLGCLSENSDACHDVIQSRNFRVNTDSFSGSSKFLTPSQYNIYTDGSKMSDGVGCGAVVLKGRDKIDQLSLKLPGYASVFFAELEAIKQSANMVAMYARNDNVKFIKIFVDSQAALKSLNKDEVRSIQVRDTCAALNKLGEHAKVTLVWTCLLYTSPSPRDS